MELDILETILVLAICKVIDYVGIAEDLVEGCSGKIFHNRELYLNVGVWYNIKW